MPGFEASIHQPGTLSGWLVLRCILPGTFHFGDSLRLRDDFFGGTVPGWSAWTILQSEDSLQVMLKVLGPYHHFECLVLQGKCEREAGVYQWSNSAETSALLGQPAWI